MLCKTLDIYVILELLRVLFICFFKEVCDERR